MFCLQGLHAKEEPELSGSSFLFVLCGYPFS